jgi:hypothetical protein
MIIRNVPFLATHTVVRNVRQSRSWRTVILACMTLLATNGARADELPPALSKLLPPSYDVLAVAFGRLTGGPRDDYVIALDRHDDQRSDRSEGPAPARPLLLFRARGEHGFALAGRNDQVVFRRDEGGQCDPFEDEDGLVMKGHYVTVQNAVACGNHWSDHITFRFDSARNALLFDGEIVRSWKMNDSNDPDAEAVVPDGPPSVDRADPRKPVMFSAWRPQR